jgi:hypothetical protein
MPNLDRVLDSILYAKEAPLRRELMEKESALRTAQTESIETQIASRKQDIDIAKHLQMRMDTLDFLKSYQAKKRAGQETTVDEDSAAWIAKVNNPYLRDKTIDEARKVVGAAKEVRNRLIKYKPQFDMANQSGQGFRINREQDPQFFEALHTFLGSQIKEGTDRTGQSAQEKNINSIFYDPSDKTVAFGLQVKDANGKTYYAPMTYGRNANPNAQVIKIPIGLIESQNRGFLVEADDLDSLRMKYGDKEATKMWEEQQRNAKENREYAKGEQAVLDILKKNPRTPLNELEAIFSKAAGESGILSEEKIINRIKQMKSEKQTRTISSDMQDFEAYSGFTPEDRGTEKYKTAFDAWEEKKSKRKIKEKQAEKSPHEAYEIKPDEEGKLWRIPKAGGKATPVETVPGTQLKGKRELSPQDIHNMETRSKNIANIVDDDEDIPEGQKEEVISKANSSDLKVVAREAVKQAKETMGIEKKWTEKGLRADLKSHGMSDREIDAYIKKAKEKGRL